MEYIQAFFDINTIFFSLLGYDISYLEFVGTIFNLVCVILVARRNIWTWPIGIIGVLLFGILFYQINLYADFFEQIYYFITGIAGWYIWHKTRKDPSDQKVAITKNSTKTNLYWLGGIGFFSVILTYVLLNIHLWLPKLFPIDASLPALDATTTIMSFAAQYLLIKRRVESWYLWIAVDIVAIGLYLYKDVLFVSILFAIFLVNAFYGLYCWNKAMKASEASQLQKTQATS